MRRPIVKREHFTVCVDGPLDEDVRRYGSPKRIYIHTRHWLWLIGLWPSIKGQVWTGSEGYTDRYRWIVRHPKLRYHIPERCNGSMVMPSTPHTYASNVVTITDVRIA